MADQNSDFDQIVLDAVKALGDNAYGVTIRQTVERVTGRFTGIGAVYVSLERLTERRLVTSFEGESTPERGNRPKRYYRPV